MATLTRGLLVTHLVDKSQIDILAQVLSDDRPFYKKLVIKHTLAWQIALLTIDSCGLFLTFQLSQCDFEPRVNDFVFF